MPEKILLIVRSPPYGSSNATECFRIALGMIGMDLLPRLLFIEDGVYCLIRGNKSKVPGFEPFYERLKTLADMVGLYAVKESLDVRGLKTEDLEESYNVNVIKLERVAKLISENEVLIAF